MGKNRKKQTLIVLAVIAIGMFGFAFLNIPFYNMFCKAIGFNLSPNNPLPQAVASDSAATGRKVTVTYSGVVAGKLPVAFSAKEPVQRVVVGEMFENAYRFVNLSPDTIYFRPVHSILPQEAAKKFTMVKCFCFDDMTMYPGEERIIPVISVLDPSLDPKVGDVTLHYTLFEKTREDFQKSQQKVQATEDLRSKADVSAD